MSPLQCDRLIETAQAFHETAQAFHETAQAFQRTSMVVDIGSFVFLGIIALLLAARVGK
jgi:hypothetical protein